MIQASEWLLTALVRSTVGMMIAAVIALVVVKVVRLRDPRMEQQLWLLVLLQGVLFVPVTIGLPILPAAKTYEVRLVGKEQSGLLPSEAASIEEEVLAEKPLVEGELSKTGLGSGERFESSTDEGHRIEFESRRLMSNREWSSSVSWSAILVLTWGVGIVCLIGVGVRRYRSWMRSVKATVAAEKEWLEEWERLLKSNGVRREIPLEVVERAGPALVWGRGGYRVVVPAGRWRELDAGIREAILTHELTHYLRGHLWTSLIGRCLVLLHWFNPMAWWVLGQLEQQAEFECDEAAAEADATQLAEGLMKLGRERGTKEPVLVHCVAGGSIHERVRRLLEERKSSARWKGYASVGIGLIAILISQFPLEAIPATEPISNEPGVAAPRNQTQTEEQTKAETTAVKVAEEEPKPGPKLMYQLGSDLYRSVYGIQHLELTSDGKISVAGAGVRPNTPALNVFDTFTGEKLRTLRHPDSEGEELLSLAISPDDRLVLAGESGGWLTIWNLQSGEPLRRFQACETHITKILFHPSEKQFVCVGWNRKLFLRDLAEPEKVVREFTATDSEETGPIDFASAYCGAFTEDGENLYVISQASTLIGTDLALWNWNVPDGKLVQSGRLPKNPGGKSISSIELDPKVPEVVCITRSTEPERSAELVAMPLKNFKESEAYRRQVEFSSAVIPTPRGPRLSVRNRDAGTWSVTGVRDETIEASSQQASKFIDQFASDRLRISRDGKVAVSRTGRLSESLLAFDLEQGKLLNPEDCFLRPMVQTSSAWSNSSRFLVTNLWQGYLSLVEVETGRVKWKAASEDSYYQQVAFSSNDEFVAVFDYVRVDQGLQPRIRLHRVETGELVHQLHDVQGDSIAYPRQVRQISVTDDGKFVAVGCVRITSKKFAEPQIKVFNFQTGEDVSAKSKQVILDEKRGYGQPPRERWESGIYDDFIFVPGTHKLMLADSERGRPKENRSSDPSVVIFDADEPTSVKEIILDVLSPEEKKMLIVEEINLQSMRFSRTGNRLVSLVHLMGSTVFYSWEFENGEYVGVERAADRNQYFVIDRVLNDEFFVTQPRILQSDQSFEAIQYRSMKDGSLLREFELERDNFSHWKSLSPNGERMFRPTGSGMYQMQDLTTVPGK